MSAPEVSVVLAVRNDADGLETAARSILAQERTELELVVVDDGSVDATSRRIEELAREDGRVRAVRTPARGLTSALVAGCAAATAPLLARQDAGDRSDPVRLREQIDLLRAHDDVALVSCWTRTLGPEGEELQVVTGRRTDPTPAELDPRATSADEDVGPSSHGSALFRRSDYEAVGGYRPQFALAQDWDLWWRLAERGRFAAVTRVLYERTLSPLSLSFRHTEAQRRFGRLARAAALARRRGEPEGPVLRSAAGLATRLVAGPVSERTKARGLYFIGTLLRRRGDPRAGSYFRRAIESDPLHWRAWLRWIAGPR